MGRYSNELFTLEHSMSKLACGMQFGTVRFPTLYSIYYSTVQVQSLPGALNLRDKTLASYATQNGHPLTGPEFLRRTRRNLILLDVIRRLECPVQIA